MAYVDKKLLKAANEGSKYIKLSVGEEITGKYIRCSSKIDKKFGKLKWDFVFEVNGQEKLLSTSSAKVLKKIAYIKPGTIVVIQKLGEQQQTDYSFEKVDLNAPLKKKKKKRNRKPIKEEDEEEDEDEDEEEEEEEEDEDADDEEEDDKAPF